ncbi:MAG TPA: type I-E CRISPR-associated protein Cas5/CasD [Anaerolineae bacterium]|nr:type I-E CRISPR-associated protein Cas5/CasD [Anaerolineae bacterium]
MAANTLFLQIEGPLQSWGERAWWSVRDTAPEPTKSGIVGLLGCALGVRDDETLRALSKQLRMGVRCDQPGRQLVDYHTVGGGYDEPTLLTAEGKPKKIPSSGAPHTEQTWRSYLCDAAFLVALQGSPELIAQLAAAIQSPHWPIYLGRKACVPTRPPFDGVGEYANLELALCRDLTTPTRAVIECLPTDANAVRRRDAVDSHAHWTYGPRYVYETLLSG